MEKNQFPLRVLRIHPRFVTSHHDKPITMRDESLGFVINNPSTTCRTAAVSPLTNVALMLLATKTFFATIVSSSSSSLQLAQIRPETIHPIIAFLVLRSLYFFHFFLPSDTKETVSVRPHAQRFRMATSGRLFCTNLCTYAHETSFELHVLCSTSFFFFRCCTQVNK